MSNWETVTLGTMLEFQRGFDTTQAEQEDGDVPVVSSGGVTSYHNVAKVKAPGVVIGRKGTLGKVYLVKKDYWPHSTTLWVKNFKGNDPVYLYYFLQLMHFETFDAGASNPTLNRNHIHKLLVKCPPLPIQRKIAAILSAYDDLIENNTRRIALLEKMAEEVYREWFVRLWFPGHESVAVKSGVPEGWEIKPSSELLNIMSGGTPKTDNPVFWDGEIPFFTPRDVSDSFFVTKAEKTITEKGLRSCNSLLYPKNTIFITARGTVGKIVLAGVPMAMNQTCYALSPKNGHEIPFYFHALRDSVRYIQGISKSGVFDNIVVDTFRQIPILYPSENISCLD